MSIILALSWSLAINIDMVYSDSVCPALGCCHPKSITANAQTTFECSLFGINDCMISYGSTCYWDCNPLQTQMNDAILAQNGYSNKIFNGIESDYATDEFEPPSSLDDVLQYSDDDPSTVDEMITAAGISTLDDCGIQYDYQLNSIAAESILDDIDNGEYDDDRDIVEDVLMFGDGADGIIEAIRRRLQPDAGILGPDDRHQILNHDVWINAVGQIRRQGRAHCTGTLITSRHIITAGHCVYYDGVWENVADLTFVPGVDNIGGTFPSYQVEAAETFRVWVDNKNWAYDMALMRLNTDVASSYAIPWEFAARNIGFGESLHHIGYPGDKADFSRWYEYCPFDREVNTNFLVSNTCDYIGGMSGGPVFDIVQDPQRGVIPVIRCIISFGIDHVSNTCARLTPQKVAAIRGWISSGQIR